MDESDGVGPAEAAVTARAKALEDALSAGTPVDWPAEYRLLLERHGRLAARLNKVVTIADGYQATSRDLIERLERVNEQFHQLRDLGVPVCRYCGQVRVDAHYQARVEEFLKQHADLGLARGVCTHCLEERYGERVRPALPAAREPGPRPVAAPVADSVLNRVRATLADPANADAPLAAPLADLAERYEKLLRRLNKLVLISDRFQNQLQDSNLRLEHLASTDILTGLTSRQAMSHWLEAQVRRARGEHRPLALLSLDIDHFKEVNDTYGHEAGDAVLVTVAAAIQRDRRRGDQSGRWGGEEFVVVLPDCTFADALLIAEKLRATIAEQWVIVGERPIAVTASIGVASFTPDDTVDDLLRRADQAMYAAKHGGRNRVVG
ncbi:diguanylate cyclase [uncultured Thiodictyon sp.]|uniref:GGDEF domain-containing protein n=1 Tax=uncultured Thiodictyon sp. TaxID=1846217 RepID=UPI0025D8A722|nr:diguanylate cyclase [uncultured Thiodictyon sp.]